MRAPHRTTFLFLLLMGAACAPSPPGSPGGPWQQYADVRQAGFDPAALQAVCKRADQLHSGALLAVFRGRVLLACGDVSREFESHSIRKSLVSGLYGTAVARGEVNLDATLADLLIDERTPLTDLERSATIRHVISARSGVYLPAAYGASQDARRPERGSSPPGARWLYNNWDFNVAGVIYERVTRMDLYESFHRRLAMPLGMEDWTPADGFRVYEPTKSQHPAHTFRISARDLARFGQLYLQKGQWHGARIISPAWVAASTRPHTDDGDGTGYGYMWWTYQAGSQFTARYPSLGKLTFFRALGTGDQGLWVMPGADLVVVHRADTDHNRRIGGDDHWALVESIVAARRGESRDRADLRPLRSSMLASQLPAVPIPEYRAPVDGTLNHYAGDYRLGPGPAALGGYEMTPGAVVRVFLFDEKLFVQLPGVGDVQLFPAGRDRFAVRVLLGLGAEFEIDGGTPRTIVLTLGGDKVIATR